MRYRRIGRWGIGVSAVGLGSWLTYGGSVEEQTARAIVKHAYDRGVTFFDGKRVRGWSGGRDLRPRAGGIPHVPRSCSQRNCTSDGERANDRGLSRKHIREQSDASLWRLGSTTSTCTSATATTRTRRSKRRAPR